SGPSHRERLQEQGARLLAPARDDPQLAAPGRERDRHHQRQGCVPMEPHEGTSASLGSAWPATRRRAGRLHWTRLSTTTTTSSAITTSVTTLWILAGVGARRNAAHSDGAPAASCGRR